MENTSKENVLYKRGTSEIYAECAAEYILPDYKGDVKRILHAEASALPVGGYGDGEEREFCGNLIFNVIYLDSDNNLSAVSFGTDYSLKTPYTQETETVLSRQAADGVNIRLTGPRKMLARCAVRANVKTECKTECSPVGSTFDGENLPEVCAAALRTAKILRGKLEGREYAEDFFFIPGAVLDDVEIITKRAELKINSAFAKEGAVGVSGEILVSAIVKNADSAPYIKEMKIPFDESIELTDCLSGMEAAAAGEIVSLECTLSPTDDGVRAVISTIADFDTEVYTNVSADVLVDVFSPACEVENKYESVKYEEFIGAKYQCSRFGIEIEKSKTDAECASDIVYMNTETKLERVKCEGSSITVDGEVHFSGVACEIYEDGVPTYTSFKFSVPFSEGVNLNTQIPKGSSLSCSAVSVEPKITLDEENFYAECTLCISASVFAERELTRLASSEAIAETDTAHPTNVVSVYYPEESDTLFGVAKKFKISPIKIAEDNALTAEAVSAKGAASSLSSVSKLIIKSC